MTASPCVLIVEDDYLLLEMLSGLCERHGVHVMAASSAKTGLALLRRRVRAVDWLLIDSELRGPSDRRDLIAAYHGIQPMRPVIYASSVALPARRRTPNGLFVHKPFQNREIVSLARMMVSEAATPPALRAAS